MTTTARTVSDFFDSYATDFDAIYGTKHTFLNQLINKHLRKSMRLRFERTIAGCDPIEGRTVLDVGCGPGHYGITLARRGAAHVLGLDFAERMLEVAREHAERAGVDDKCEWALGDFLTYPLDRTYDYAIVMGFMDYIAEPAAVIERVLSASGRRAFFSFPVDGGFLAWQRKYRYRKRCELYMYTPGQVRKLFEGVTDRRLEVDPISRDLFVTVDMEENR